MLEPVAAVLLTAGGLVVLVAVHGITQFTSRNADQTGLRSASAGA
jgi:hypothetical protein